jgi:hypothetical protein
MLPFVVRPHSHLALVILTCSACSGLGGSEIISLRDAAPPPVDDPVKPMGEPDDAGPPAPNFPGFPDGSYEAAPHANERVIVYAHSGSTLFGIDPETLAFNNIGPFVLVDNGRMSFIGNVTDIAVDREGRIVGTTFTNLLSIDPRNANCTTIARLPPGHAFNGLSWVRAGQANERLLATAVDGTVYEINPMTGDAQSVGRLGMGLGSSGDLVSVEGYGTLVTVKGNSPTAPDQLATIDPATGVATVIGPTGFQKIWGLGFWKNKVFGFTQTGQFVLIDPKTGAAMLVQGNAGHPFWGAGVTTAVPVIF